MTSVRLPREIVHERSVHEKPFTVGQSGSKHPDAPARLLRSHTRALTALARQRDTMQAQGVSHEVMLTTFGSRLIASRNSRPPAAGFGQCPGCTRAHLSAGACVATDQVVDAGAIFLFATESYSTRVVEWPGRIPCSPPSTALAHLSRRTNG